MGRRQFDDIHAIVAQDVEQRHVRAAAGFRESAAHWIKALAGKAPLLDLTEKARLGSLFTFRDVEWGIPELVRELSIDDMPVPVRN